MVVDLSQALSGPHATTMPGSLGSMVIKVEARYFAKAYGVGDVVDVGSYDPQGQRFEVDDEGVTIAEIRSETSGTVIVVEDASGRLYAVDALSIRKRCVGS